MFNKLKQQFLFILMLTGIFFTGCKKDHNYASLRITLVDQANNLISGGSVKLKTIDFFQTNSSGEIVGTGAVTGEYYGVSGSDGNVFFQNLNPLKKRKRDKAVCGCLCFRIFNKISNELGNF